MNTPRPEFGLLLAYGVHLIEAWCESIKGVAYLITHVKKSIDMFPRTPTSIMATPAMWRV